MTIEMSIEMILRRKIVGISRTRDMREGLEITMKMLMKTGTARIKIGINIETDTEMTVMTRLKHRSKEKDYLCDDDDIFHSKIEGVHKIL